MKAMDIRKIMSALLAGAILLCMASCGKKDKDGEDGGDEPEAPELIEEYPFGELTVPGLTSEDATAAVKTAVTYSYTGLSSPGGTVKSYVSLMTSEENGFAVVDSEFVISEEPGYGEQGSVLLARSADAAAESGEDAGDESEADGESGGEEPAAPKNRLLLMDISWDSGGCVIVTSEAEGVISQPPEPMTMYEAQQYLESLTPEKLGLDGESMDEYEVFTFDGAIAVDGRACVRMNVYNIDNVQQSNEFMGCYLVSLDGRHIYRLDTSTDEITELE